MILTLTPPDMIYYSHVNEDNRVERQLLQKSKCDTVVGVAGSGERILALMDNTHSTQFHVVDVNEEALFLVELKLAALQYLGVEEYLSFCGHYPAPGQQRNESFHLLKDRLRTSCKMYWQQNIALIEKGIVDAGHFERFLQRVRPVVKFILGRNFMAVLSGASANSKKFPNRRWKLTREMFSRQWIYKAWGNKDIAFTGKSAAIRLIPEALNSIIHRGEASSSFIAHLIFKGHLRDMKEADMPPSLQKEVLSKIRHRLTSNSININYHHIDVLAFARNAHYSLPGHVFYSLSDILSFESVSYLEELVAEASLPGNMIVWRTFLRNRSQGPPKTSHKELQDLTAGESTQMYQVFATQKKSIG